MTIPKTMKAAYLNKSGDPTNPAILSVKPDVDVPCSLKKGQLLVKVAAASINPVDWKIMRGDLPLYRKGVVGFDVSGTIVQIAEGTETNLQVGDKIYADGAPTPGSFAEYMKVAAVAAHKVPTKTDMMQAASLPLCGLTALQGLVTHGGLKEGQKVCILGGSGGVGSLAVQVAKALGASRVVATGSSVDMIKKLGADEVINYKEKSVVEALQGQEFDIIFDTVGGVDGWLAGLKGGLKKSGRYITVAGDGGYMFMDILSWGYRYFKSLFGLCPSYKFFLTSTSSPAVQADMKKLTELVESGKVKPVLDGRTFSLTTESIHDMIKASMSHRAKGKLVLKVDC